MGTLFTACTTTKHILKKRENIKIYKASNVIETYGYYETRGKSEYLLGFSFTEQQEKKGKENYPIVPIPPGENPLSTQTMSVNIDLCKHWKETSFRKRPLEEFAYGRNYSSFNPTEYKLFMSLEKLKKKNLVPLNVNEQEDICIYIDREYAGHFGQFKDKSNKIHYKASEINNARKELENK